MDIRLIKEDEFQEISSFLNAYYQENKTSDTEIDHQSYLDYLFTYRTSLTVLGAYDKELVGILAYRNNEHQIVLFIANTPTIRKELFEYFVEECKKENIARITVLVLKDDYPAYEDLGFELVDEEVQLENFAYTIMEYHIDQDILGKEVTVVVDHPYGSAHLIYPDTDYPCNMGYVEDLVQEKELFQEAYIYGVNEPVETFKGKVIGIIYYKDDVISKWIVSKEENVNHQEVIDTIGPLEQYLDTKILWYK